MPIGSILFKNSNLALTIPLMPPTPKKQINNKDFRRFGFTLAETLITLAIIGVVAAISIPSLISKYKKHTYVVGLKKAYSVLNNAHKNIPLIQGCSPEDYACALRDVNCTPNQNGNDLYRPFAKALKVAAPIDISDDVPYAAINSSLGWENVTGTYKYLNNSDVPTDALTIASDSTAGVLVLDDGMILMLSAEMSSYKLITVDVNGNKGPNTVGRDVFTFYIDEDYKLIPCGAKYQTSTWPYQSSHCPYWKESSECSNTGRGYSCTARVLEEDAMNY